MMKFIRVQHNESIVSIAFRFIRAIYWMLTRRHTSNHFCPGESGNGEWSCRASGPGVCGYCFKPNARLDQQEEAQ